MLFFALAVGVFGADLPACTTTCESECDDAYDDCLARSPPGASKADCGAAYQRCLSSCSASLEPAR